MLPTRRIQEGCFVFQVLEADRLFLLPTPDLDEEPEDEEEYSFDTNELIAVDLIQPAPQKSAFVRLADQSGWILAASHGEVFLRPLPVTTDRLFTFYVDCTQLVRRHPMDDSSDLLTNEEQGSTWQLEPMQKIYCDAMVEHPISGVKFYRIQGGSDQAPVTPGWVHDKEVSDDGTFQYLLLPCEKVTKGLFAYRALRNLAFRERPDCTEESKTAGTVLKNELVVADMVRESPVENSGNGPFMRVTDGSGWLFVNMLHEPIMEQVPIRRGKWILTVLNDPQGLKLQKQPLDCPDNTMEGVTYAFGTIVECDRKLSNQGVNFYRVTGTTGWLFDMKQGHPMLSLLKSDEVTTVLETESWDINYVRGIAATVHSVSEKDFDQDLKVLSFSRPDGPTVKVYCDTRTVGCMIDDWKRFEHHCTVQMVFNLLGMDEAQVKKYYSEKEATAEPSKNRKSLPEEKKDDADSFDAIMDEPVARGTDAVVANSIVDTEEEDLRKELLLLEADIFELQAKRRSILETIRQFDTQRDMQVAAEKQMAEIQQQNQLQVQLKRGISPRSQHSSVPRSYKIDAVNSILEPQSSMAASGSLMAPALSHVASSSVESTISGSHLPGNSTIATSSFEGSSAFTSRQDSQSFQNDASSSKVCHECGKEFSGKYSRDIHCREVHKLFCGHCDKIFTSFKELEIHMQKENHW